MGSLTREQSEAVADRGNTCVISIPGSGKTTMVVAKIAKILAEQQQATLTAITYTSHAATELRTRATEQLRVGDVGDRLVAGTFHALAWKTLKHKAHPMSRRRIAGAGLRNHYVRLALEGQGLPPEGDDAEWFERYWSTTTDPIEKPDRNDGAGVADYKLRRLAIADYKRLMRNAGLVDFGMILEAAVEWYGPHKNRVHIREEMDFKGSGRFFETTHMVVDEAQDIDEIQLGMILNECLRGTIVTMVGDDDQSIFGFRHGLGIDGMRRFMQAAGIEKERLLGLNFRCKGSILGLADEVIRQNVDRIPKTLTANKGPGGKVVFRSFDNDIAERTMIANEAAKAIEVSSDGKPRSAAILSRTNKVLDEVELLLKKMEVPHERLGGSSVLERAPLCYFISALEAVASAESDDGVKNAFEQMMFWLGAPRDAIAKLNKMPAKRVVAELKSGRMKGLNALGYPEEVQEVSEMLREGMDLIAAQDAGAAEMAVRSIGTKMINNVLAAEQVLEAKRAARTKSNKRKGKTEQDLYPSCAAQIASIKSVAGILGGVKALPDESMLREGIGEVLAGYKKAEDKHSSGGSVKGGRKGSLASRLMALKGLGQKESEPGAKVTLSTMHSSKGLEFDKTYIVGADAKTMKCEEEDEALVEEERRLLYVAITRAREEVWVTYHKEVVKKVPEQADAKDGPKPKAKQMPVVKEALKMCTYIETTRAYANAGAHEYEHQQLRNTDKMLV